MPITAILDIDGTLVDTNYHHALAWYRAFSEHGLVLPLWRIHRHIGMGGDQLVEALAGEEFEREHGDATRASEKERYSELIDEVRPLPGARDLLVRLDEEGHSVVLASSAKEDEVEHYVDLLEARELAHAWTSSADVETTKPAPDLVQAAFDRGAERNAVMVGDSTFDCEAAGRAGIPTLAVLTGGFSEQELRDAGAESVYYSPEEILERWDQSPFGLSASRPGNGVAMEGRGEESDQLPEEAPSEQVHEDDSEGEARDEAEENAGVPDNPGQATGNPDNAG